MRALLATQFSIVPHDGRYYTKSAFAAILRRYGAAFGPLTLCVPVKQTWSPLLEDVTEAVSQMVPISRNDSILRRQRREMTRAIRESDLVIVRCHSFVAFWASDLAHRLKKPVLAEAMSCPWDAMWNHGPLGKLIAPYMFLKMRRVMARADYALYVTQEFLQRRYPCRNPWIGASNVALPAPSEEVLTRRLQRYADGDEKFAPLPDVFLIDGGMTHAAVAEKVCAAFGLHIPIFGMVKDDRHRTRALTTAEGHEIDLHADPAVFALIGQIQEETHRFAITYHHESHTRSSVASALDGIPNIGEVRKRKLLARFKSVKAIREAELPALQSELGRAAGRAVYDHFHPKEETP